MGVGGEGVPVVTCMHALTSSAKRITMLGLSETALAVVPEVHIWKQQMATAARLTRAMAADSALFVFAHAHLVFAGTVQSRVYVFAIPGQNTAYDSTSSAPHCMRRIRVTHLLQLQYTN